MQSPFALRHALKLNHSMPDISGGLYVYYSHQTSQMIGAGLGPRRIDQAEKRNRDYARQTVFNQYNGIARHHIASEGAFPQIIYLYASFHSYLCSV